MWKVFKAMIIKYCLTCLEGEKKDFGTGLQESKVKPQTEETL